MLVKEVFKQLYNHSFSKQNPTWELECDCESQIILELVERLLQDQLMELFETHQASEKVIPIIHLHFDELISWKNRSKLKEHKEIFFYLQFTWAICAVTHLNYTGEFIYCYDIFMKSVFDKTFQNGEQYDLEEAAPYRLKKSSNNYIANSDEIVEQWFTQLYYYSKSFSGLDDWCVYFFQDLYYDLKENLKIEIHHPQLLSNLFSWCSMSFDIKGSNAIRNIIQREYDLISWSEAGEKKEIKNSLGLQLLLCNNYMNSDKKNLYTELEDNFELNPLAKMQACLALCYDDKNLTENLDLLFLSIKEYNEFLETQNLDVFAKIYQKSRLFKILNDVICISSILGKAEVIEKILLLYYDIKDPQEIGKTLFIIPNQEKKVVYSFKDTVINDEKDPQKKLIEIIDAENKAFNSFRLLKGGVKQEIISTGKPIGFPDSKMADIYETKLLELYDFKKVEDYLKNLCSICQFDFNSIPLQALMIKTIQRTLPINLSLSKKNEFGNVEKVLFWSGFSFTTEIETVALVEIFEKSNIEFEIHNQQNSSLSKFKKRIENYSPDIIWISSHGEYNHYNPNTSSIKLSEDESIEIRDFEFLINKTKKRRLLFLNVCEGGNHIQTGEFKNLGFPNLLTANNQDIISHLWMAEPNFSYVFGVFVALGITHLKMNYFEAFAYSLSHVMSSKNKIIEELNSFDLELTDLKARIYNNDSTKWGNLITTGSPVYNI